MGSDEKRPARSGPVRRGSSAVVWVDLRGDWATGGSVGTDHLLGRVTKAVRGDDRVCPVATTLVAVEFGSVGSAVPLPVLGDRIARAVGLDSGSDRFGYFGLPTAVGMAGHLDGVRPAEPEDTARRALGAARSGRSVLTAGARDLAAVVTVDQRLTGHPCAPGTATSPRPLHRRAVHRYGSTPSDDVSGPATTDPTRGALAAYDDTQPTGNLSILVVDPMATEGVASGFALAASASLLEQSGFRTGTATVSPDEPLVTTVDGSDIDLVVLVLDGAWVGRSPNWATGAWGLPSRLTTAYVDKGIPVLAVGTGAGAGAVASCVTHGALALFDLDSLATALRSLAERTIEEVRQVAELAFPDRFRALLGLTAGERRVLFYLTEGWAAQDIAEELVVSLTTVRSHIRSVLRKLEVRSQLAAVAIANSRDLDHHTLSVNL